jgi:transcriptional regulator with XRE-family HTH domain
MSAFSENLRRLRIAAGMTQEQLAHACGFPGQSRIGNYESSGASSRTPKLEEIPAIAQALGVDINTLFGWGEKTASHSHSQPVRLDPAIVRKAGVALSLRHKTDGGYSLAERPEEFVLAYELFAAGMPSAYEAPEVADLETRRAGKSPQGASEDDRASGGAPRTGATGEGVRPGRGRKAKAATSGRR